MRVAYICADPGVPVFGRKGSSIHVQEVVRALRHAGASVELGAAKFGGSPPKDLADVPCFELPRPTGAEGAEREVRALEANPTVAEWLDKRGPFDLVYERYSLWSYAGMVWARQNRVPGLLEVNAPLIEEQAEHRVLHDRASAENVAEKTFTSAKCILAVSTGVKSYLTDRGIGSDKIMVVPNGVDLGRFAATGFGPRENGAGEFTIGFVGTLKPWHGLSTLIAAAKQVRSSGVPFRLLVVGDGPERPRIEDEVEAAGLADSVEFTGAVAPEKIPELLARMDVAVAPYPDLSGFYFSPLKIMEYMAAGLPTVASRIGDIDGLLVDGQTGLLCPPGDMDALTHALLRLHREPDLRQRLGATARGVAQDLGWARVADRILFAARELAEAEAPAC